jgi:hypothetical protein
VRKVSGEEVDETCFGIPCPEKKVKILNIEVHKLCQIKRIYLSRENDNFCPREIL